MAKEMFISSSPHETKVAVLEDDQLVEVYYERDTAVGLVGGIYKGRVSRVLPGMQSAFVDVGLERDAFLYVSDFFLEDQEEYDKVFTEAESRATRYTAESAPATPTTGSAVPQGAAPGVMTFPAPPATREAVEPPVAAAVPEPAAREIPPAAPVAPLQHEAAPAPPAAPVSSPGRIGKAEERPTPPAPPAGTAGGAGPEHRRFDPRGRRRRRGRHDFAETRRPERPERPFTPRPEFTQPHTFEVLPGESLAKYSHGSPPAPAEESNATAEVVGTPPLSGADGDLQLALVTPAGTGDAAGHPYVADEEVQTPPATATVEGPEEVASPALVEPELPSTLLSEAEQRQSLGDIEESGTAAAPQADVIGQMAGGPAEPLAEAPEAPASVEEAQPVPGAAEPSRIETPPVPEPIQSAAPPEAAPIAIPQGEMATPTLPPEEAAADASQDTAPDVVVQGQAEAALGGEATETALTDAAEHLPGGAPEPVVLSEAGQATEALPEGGPEPQAPSPQPSREPEAPQGGGERTYTLREPHQRPRFAPRRGRRGRRGAGEPRGQAPSREAPSRPGNNQPLQIAELLKEGQEILVQIAKEPLGTKGARITSHVALPGRYLVYMPTIEHIGVSRKIASEEERLRLRNIILENKGSLTGGFIVRTAGQGRSEEEFKADLRFLSALWSEIRAKAEKAKSPALIHRDLDLVQRLLRDTLTPDFKNIRVDNEIEYERVLDFVSRSQPSLVGKVKLYTRDTPMFEEFGVQAEIEKALRPKVWLKSGGYIVINQTEALVAVDVNTGKYVGKTNRLEDTILKTNVDAVNEIVRQVRLRDLGGIIVIDFIDMDERKNRMRVVQALEEALRRDRAPTKVIAFHDFGLVAITRKRVKQSLERTLCEPCGSCAGSGWIKSVTTVCYEILAEAKKMAHGIEGDSLTLRVNPEVAKALKSREGVMISELESMTHKDVIIKSDPVVPQERFEIF